ncbi:MAG: hypothetical protein GY862_07415 [Gammaproteobacteria bacterium]|nr:hypothetical protein [Gammaproteobacteria bacterium]
MFSAKFNAKAKLRLVILATVVFSVVLHASNTCALMPPMPKELTPAIRR